MLHRRYTITNKYPFSLPDEVNKGSGISWTRDGQISGSFGFIVQAQKQLQKQVNALKATYEMCVYLLFITFFRSIVRLKALFNLFLILHCLLASALLNMQPFTFMRPLLSVLHVSYLSGSWYCGCVYLPLEPAAAGTSVPTILTEPDPDPPGRPSGGSPARAGFVGRIPGRGGGSNSAPGGDHGG